MTLEGKRWDPFCYCSVYKASGAWSYPCYCSAEGRRTKNIATPPHPRTGTSPPTSNPSLSYPSIFSGFPYIDYEQFLFCAELLRANNKQWKRKIDVNAPQEALGVRRSKSPFDLRDGLRRKGRTAGKLSLTCCCWPLHRWVERGTVTVFVKFFTHVLFQLYALNIHQKVSMMFSMSGCRCYKRWLCCRAKLKHVRLIAGSTDGSERFCRRR